jgi:hypothetical protein
MQKKNIGHIACASCWYNQNKKKLAKQLSFWPGMKEDIARTVENCVECQIIRSSKPEEMPVLERTTNKPMEKIAVDLLDCKGYSYLVMVCSLPFVSKLVTKGTASIIKV